MRIVREDDLQTMCLNIIVECIGKFAKKHATWDADPGKSSRESIHFLRRVYSDRLYELMKSKDHSISSGVMDFLFTRYWNKVEMRSHVPSYDGLFRRLTFMGTAITSLKLKDSTAPSHILTAIICCVPNIVYLNLVGTECTDSALTLISKTCKSLVSLNLEDCQQVTNVGIENLCNLDSKESGFNSLKALNIDGTGVTQESIPIILKHLPFLEYLRYKVIPIVMYNLFRNSMNSLTARYNLKCFEFNKASEFAHSNSIYGEDYIDLCDTLEMWSVLCPRVTKISVEGDIDEKFLKICSKFEDVTTLELSSDYSLQIFTDSELFRLKASQLTHLSVCYAAVSIGSIVEQCKNLKKLCFEEVIFVDFNMSASSIENAKLNKLESLSITSANFSFKNDCKSLKTLLHFSKNLVELTFLHCVCFNGTVVSWIMKLPNLRFLHFGLTDVKPKFVGMFMDSKNIKHIEADVFSFSKHIRSINDKSQVNTCGWKTNFHFTDDLLSNKVLKSPWAGELTI